MTEPAGPRYALSPKARLVIDRVRGNPILLYPERGLLLNATGHAIAEACARTTTVAALLDELQRRFPDTDPHILEQDARAFLAELAARGLLRELQ